MTPFLQSVTGEGQREAQQEANQSKGYWGHLVNMYPHVHVLQLSRDETRGVEELSRCALQDKG